MKKFLFSFLVGLISMSSYSQISVFHENFENPSSGDSVFSSGFPVWSINTVLYSEGLNSYRDTVDAASTAYLTTNSFSTIGSSIVTLKFDQICKIEHFDSALVEVSIDGGTNWIRLTSNEYTGSGQFASLNNRFTSTSYIADWLPSQDAAVPTNAWWKSESFSIGAIAGNKANVKVRFVLRNGIGGIAGSAGNYGWLIDNINVIIPNPQDAEIMSWALPYSVTSGCGLTNETIRVKIKNSGAQPINGNFSVSFQREGSSVTTENISSSILIGDSLTYTFTNTVDLSTTIDTNYKVKVWANLTGDINHSNDTILKSVVSKALLVLPVCNDVTIAFGTSVTLNATHTNTLSWYSDALGLNKIHTGLSYTTPILLDTTTYYVQAKNTSGGSFFMTEVAHYKVASGAPVGGWPAYLKADDYIEVVGVPGSDLAGYTLEQWSTTALTNTHTFPTGTIMSPAGTAVIAVGQPTTSVPSPSDYYYHGVTTTSFSSTGVAGRILKDPSGVVIDAVGYGAFTFPAIANVSSADWSGNTPATSSSGNRLVGPYTKSSANWINSSVSPQDPNILNSGVTLPELSGCPSLLKPVKVMISGIPQNNAGIAAINSPASSISLSSNVPITVTLKNYAADTLKNVSINYTVNGATRTPFVWTGSLPYNQSTQVTIGTETFNYGIYAINSWTSNPNGFTDGFLANDSTTKQVNVRLSGSFDIAGLNADFQSIQNAIDTLNLLGVSGPVTFNIAAGTYTGPWKFSPVAGASSQNTITFKSADNDSTSVILTGSSFATIYLNGADYFKFKNLSISSTATATTKAIGLLNGADNNTIENCIISVPSGSTSTVFGIYDTLGIDNYNAYINNKFTGGYASIYINGTSSTVWGKGNFVLENDMSDFYYYGIYSQYQDSIHIKNNYIHDNATTTGYIYGIWGNYNFQHNFSGNKIIISPATYGYGIRDYYSNYYASYNVNMVKGLVYNNFVTILSGTYNYGLYSYYCSNTHYYYNSILVMAGTTTSYAMYHNNTASNTYGVTFKNNNFINKFGSYAAYFANTTLVTDCDYNNYFTSGTNLVYWGAAVTNLADLQTASGKDTHSKNLDPGYVSNSNLHITNPLLNAAGTAVSDVLTDIDNEVRNAITPDIGADEIDVLSLDAGIFALNSPIISCPNSSASFNVEIKNYGSDTIHSMTVNWSINGVVKTPFNYTGSLAFGHSVNITLGNHTILTDSMYNFKFWTSNPNASSDLKNSNDTLKITNYSASLAAGVYSIGPDATDDWANFNDAVSALSHGVCGPVVIKIKNGTYNEQVTIPEIGGTSAINTVTFQSFSGDSSAVLLTSAGNTLVFDGADFITVKNISIATSSITAGSNVVSMGYGANNNTISNCKISMPNTTSAVYGIYNLIGNDNYNIISNNKIEGGYGGVYMTGTSTSSWDKGNRVIGNDISDYYYYGIFSQYQDSVIIQHNNIHDNTTTTGYIYGIYSNYNFEHNFSYNKISISPGTYGYGIRDYYNNYYSFYSAIMAPGLISNNFVTVFSGTYAYGIYTYYSNNINCVYNSVNILGGNPTTSYALYQYNTASNSFGQTFKNNNLVNKATGYAAYYSTVASVMATDYNNYFSNGVNLGYWGAAKVSLADMQLASSKDANSKNVDPSYYSTTDLHMNNTSLNAAGNSFADVLDDIDGELRDPSTPDIGADEYFLVTNDAGVTAINSPISVCPNISAPINVSLKNFGIDTILNCNVNWSINGVIQTPFSYSGAIAFNQSVAVSIGSYTFLSNTAYSLKVWTSNPNGQADQIVSNDTIVKNNFFTSLIGGTYTIGPNVGDTWTSFGDAINALSNGICGPIVINVKNGTYNEQISLTSVLGSSEQNTITFQSFSGDSSQVILTSGGATISLLGADNFIFKQITIKTTSSTASTHTIHLGSGADNNKILNCFISMPVGSTTLYGIYNASGNDHNNAFIGNRITGGYCGIYAYGDTYNDLEKGSIIAKNDISSFYYYGIYSYYQDSIQIVNNFIHDNATTTGYIYGIYSYYNFNGTNLSGNKISINPGSYGYGIYNYYNNYYSYYLSTMATGIISNNFISVLSGTYNYGIYAYYSNNVSYYNNSVLVTAGTTTSYGFYYSNSASSSVGVNIVNNSFANQYGSYAAYYANTTQIINCDYNNYFTTGTNLVYWGAAKTSLADLRLASNKDLHSLNANPNYISTTNLHLFISPLNAKGSPLANILVDIDGETRNATTPDIGADEFLPPYQEVGLAALVTPITSSCGLMQDSIKVKIVNYGTDPIQGGLTLSYSFDNGITAISENVPDYIEADDTLVFTFASPANFNITQDSIFHLWVWADLVNDIYALNDTIKVDILNKILPNPPGVANATTTYGNSATLSLTSPYTILWFNSLNSTTPIASGANFTTPILFGNTTYWAAAQSSSGCRSLKDSALVTISNIPIGDLSITGIHTNSGCGIDSTELVTIDIHNQGIGTVLNGATASFKVGNGVWTLAENVLDSIPSNATIQFTFNATANLYASKDTLFEITAAVTLGSDPYHINDSLTKDSIKVLYTPADPITNSPVNCVYGTSATLSIQSQDSIFWYENISDTTAIGRGLTFNTPLLFDTTAYYVQAVSSEFSIAGEIALAPSGGLVCTNVDKGGNMFDVYATSEDLIIKAMDLRFDSIGVKPVRIYYRMGSYDGNETDSTKWIFHDQRSATTTSSGQLANIQIMPLFVPKGKTVGIYVMYDANYMSGGNTFQNSDIKVTTGVGLCGSFSGLNIPRSISGKLYYEKKLVKCLSNKVPVVVNTSTPPPIDAGMYSLVNPSYNVISGLSIPIQVNVKNFGTDTIHSLNITYELNGTIENTFAWSGTIIPGNISNTITIANTVFNGGFHNLKFWVSNANGTSFGINANDTLVKQISACLSGVYTIGNPTSDYPTFASALNVLNTSGVCGNVIFKIEPDTYNIQLTLKSIQGVGPQSRITFESITGDSTDVVIQYAASGTSNNWTVRFDGADYYTLKNITVRALNPTFATAIEVYNGANFNVVENCVIQSTGIVADNRCIYDNTTINNNNTYRNNKIMGGYYAIYSYGTSSTVREKGTVIHGNDISGFYYAAIYSSYQDSIQITNNNIHSNMTTTGYIYGIYANYNYNGYNYSGNNISIAPGTYGFGIRDYYGNYYTNYTSTMSPGKVYNNAVNIATGTYNYGLYTYYCNNVSYDFNTFLVRSGTTTSYAMYYSNSASNTLGVNLRNNIYVNKYGSYAAYFSNTTQVMLCDYNDYYSTGSNLAYWGAAKTSLADLQSASGKDLHSKNIDPNFISSNNIHASNVALNGTGIPIPTITHDIDGELRNTTTPDIGADEFDPIPNDAIMLALVNPKSPVSMISHPIYVKFGNFGNDTLVSLNINWSVNNIAQAPFAWTGSLATSQTADSVLIGNYTFSAGAKSFKIWTSQPNGVTDGNKFNDTIYKVLIGCAAPLKGVYSIGGTGADFPTFESAVQSLNYCGIDSNVVFNVNSGTYNEQILFGAIPGSGPTKTITIKSLNNDSTSVILTYANSSSSANYVLRLNGTSYLSISNISIVATNSLNGTAVQLLGGAHHNTFENNIIKASNSTATTCRAIDMTLGSNENFNSILNNKIEKGYYGIYSYGVSTTNWEKGTLIKGNDVSGFYSYGIYTYYGDSTQIIGNYVHNGVNTTQYGVYCYYNNNGYRIINNTITLTPSSNAYGLYDYYNNYYSYNPSPSATGLVANNMISISSGTGTNYGLYTYYCNGTKYYYNTVNISAGTTTSYVVYQYNTSSNSQGQTFKNNIFVNKTGGYAFYAGTKASILACDYNDFYTTGSSFVYWGAAVTSLSALKTTSGMNAHSLNIDPGFYSNTNLHISAIGLNEKGTPLPIITNDIDGDLRNATTPDIGADEISPLTIDPGVYSIVNPIVKYAPVGTATQVEVEVRNFGTDTIHSFTLNYKYASTNVVTQSWTGNIAPGANAFITFNTSFTTLLGQNSLQIFVDSVGNNLINDTLKINFMGIPIISPSYSENFDQSVNYWSSEGIVNIWQQGLPNATKINSAKTAPNVWATNLNGQYSPNLNQEYLYTPYFDFSNITGATMKFWHWYETQTGSDYGKIQYSEDQGLSWTNLGYVNDPNGTNWYNTNISGIPSWTGSSNGWVQSKYNLAQFDNSLSPIQFRFQFSSNSSTEDDGWAIDNFEIALPLAPIDAKLESIVTPINSLPAGSTDSVRVRIKNEGSNTLTSIPITYRINNQNPSISDIWTGSLAPNATVNFTFASPLTIPYGTSFSICARVNVAGDLYNQNDSLCETVLISPPTLDAGVVRIESPVGDTTFLNNPQTVKVWIKNFGTTTLTSMNVQYKAGIQSPVIATWNGSLVHGDSTLYTFTQTYLPQPAWYQLCAKTLLTNDLATFNDEVCKNKGGFVGLEEIWSSNYILEQNIPNPILSSTIINFETPYAGTAKFQITDIVGRVMYTEEKTVITGRQFINLDVNTFSNGVYYYSLEFMGHRLVRKMIIAK